MLKPNEEIHKVIISTPARFVGGYMSEDTAVQLSFSNKDTITDITENPNSRTFLVVTFRYVHDGSILLRDLSVYGDFFCTILSLLYGKEFKNHGLLESYGIHRTPNLALSSNEYYYQPQYNYQPRKDLSIPLDLSCFKLIEPLLLENGLSDSFRQMIIAAGKFYNRALSIYPTEPELAFLDLITCGEIISNFNEEQYTEEQLYDENLLNNFDKILTLEQGDRIVRDLKSRLFQVKRKFYYSLIELLDENFYENTEVIHDVGKITKDTIEQNIKFAYDLRSLYVHTGLEFGDRIRPNKNIQNEIVIGEVTLPNQRAKKALNNTLTFTGLERIIRYALLKLIHNNGIKIDDKLD
ncbi:HEPN domain-containing protein [Bacillus cereus]|uniref:HEPN domain-containing protein n=1 Tax=Bacillus cereus TaxID=1396 RepID=UPI000B4B6699|nr:HEPN domain-containing protein [Bacillus cereus]